MVVLARLVGATLVYLAVFSIATVGLYVVGLVLVPEAAQASFGLVSLGLAEGFALGAVLLVWRRVDRRPLGQLGLNRGHGVARWLRGSAVAAAMMGLIVLALYTLVDGAGWNLNPDPVRAGAVLLGGLVGFMIQGPAEEILFRGYVLENVLARWGASWAVGVSSVAFALLHVFNPHFGVLPFLNLVLFGVATALYKLRVDNGQLWGVFGMHTVWNWLQQVVFGLPNSGGAPGADNAVFTVSPNTALPEPVWGGGFGPEGTLGASLVLLALIVAVLRWRAAARSAAA